jgi:hypothetical protein
MLIMTERSQPRHAAVDARRSSSRAPQKGTQRGAVAIVVAVILGGLAVMVVSFSSLAVNKAAFGSSERMAREVDDALLYLQAWYEQQADSIAVSGTTPSESQLQAALPRAYPGMRLAMSTSMASSGCSAGTIGCIPWRQIAAWYPATQAPTSTTLRDGIPVSEFTGNAIWRVYSSQSWYFERYAQTQSKLNETARSLMSFFAGRKGINPVSGHDTNFWRARDCAQTEQSLPCVDTYTALGGSAVASAMGLTTADLAVPIGSAIEFSNLLDSSTAPPFSVALRVVLPWGGQIRQTVLQP